MATPTAQGGNTPGVQVPASPWSNDATYSVPTSSDSAKDFIEKRAAETRKATDK